jgi:lipopolysaccharide export system protein LptA
MRLSPWALAGLMLVATMGGAIGQGAATLFSGFQNKSTDPVMVDAQTLEVFEEGKERISLFSGNVVVTRGNTTLRAGSIRLRQDLDGKSGAFTKIEAEGGVTVRSQDQTLTGKTAVVDMKTNTIVVSGGVELAQGTNRLTGPRLVVDLSTGRARIEGGTTGTFTPATP